MTTLRASVQVITGVLGNPLAGKSAGLTERAFGFLRFSDDRGVIGLGEASPLPGYSPDTLDEAVDDLGALVGQQLDLDPDADADVVLDAVAACALESPASVFAAETAALDWLGRRQGKPVHQLMRNESPGPIPVSALVASTNPADWPEAVAELSARGGTSVKIKVGGGADSFSAQVTVLERLREQLPRVGLRLDANGGLDLATLRAEVSRLEAIGLDLFEEPVPIEDWEQALELPLPLALDETLRVPETARRLLGTGRVNAIVLKPTVLGGFRASKRWAARARAEETSVVVTHTFEGPIARAACAELALALGTERAAGLGAHPALDLWPPHRIASVSGSTIASHGRAGLGLDLEELPDA